MKVLLINLKVISASNLRHGAYLKVTTKGMHVETWEEVDENDVPKVAISTLKRS